MTALTGETLALFHALMNAVGISTDQVKRAEFVFTVKPRQLDGPAGLRVTLEIEPIVSVGTGQVKFPRRNVVLVAD